MEVPSASEPAEAYDQIFRLERNLLAASKSKGPFDPSVRHLRTSIRDGYEALILRDLVLCEAFEVEQALWRLHYREIEGFRLKIRKLLTSKDHAEGNKPASDQRKKRKKENKQEPLLRTLTSFRSFLGEASGFFHGLLIKLRLQHGLASSLGNTDRFSAEGDVTEELRRCMVTCHRILIYLGDLARYKELYAVMDASVRDWSVAANYYKQAAVLWPSSGNPYNQLAVLSTYCGNSLTALYLYCRSLAVSVPFETAWENLVLLFEKNKQSFPRASISGSDGDKKFRWETTLPTNLHGFVIEQDLWSIHKVARSQGWFIMHFVELVRILLVQSSADELDKVFDATERKLERFLYEANNDVNSGKLAASALQVTTVLIFCMHHIIERLNLNGDNILSSCLRFAFKFCSSLAKGAEQRTWSAFPVAIILMEWLADQPKALQIICTEKAVGLIFSEFCEKVVSLDMSIFSKNMVDDLDHNAQMLQQDAMAKIADKAQWEDHELLGFVPLASTHLRLDFSSQLPGYGVCNLATYSCWKLRYTDALQKLWSAVGQSNSGCLFKIPDPSLTNLATEESNPTPSLKEWIEKTFFSTDALTDLVRVKQVEVQCNRREGHLHDEVASAVHGLENDDPCDVQISSKPDVKSPFCEASTEMVRYSGEHSLEHYCKDVAQPIVPGEQQALTTSAIMMLEEISSTKADLVKVESTPKIHTRRETCDFGCSTKPLDLVVSDVQIQTLSVTKAANKLTDINEERISSFRMPAKASNQDFSGKHSGIISYLSEQQTPSLLCLDSITHVKPRVLIEAFTRYSWNSSSINNSAASRFNGQLSWDNKAYATQNPFVLRLRKLS